MTKLENDVIEYLKKYGDAISANEMLRAPEFFETDFLDLYKVLSKLADEGTISRLNTDGKVFYKSLSTENKKTFMKPLSAVKSGPILKNPLADTEATDQFDTVTMISEYENIKKLNFNKRTDVFTELKFSGDRYKGSGFTIEIPEGFNVFEGSITNYNDEVSCTREFVNGVSVTMTVGAESINQNISKFGIVEEFQTLARYYAQTAVSEEGFLDRQDYGVFDYSDTDRICSISYVFMEKRSGKVWYVFADTCTMKGIRQFRFDFNNIDQYGKELVLEYVKKWVDTILFAEHSKILPNLDDGYFLNRELDRYFLEDYLRCADKTFKHVDANKELAVKFTETYLEEGGRALARNEKRQCISDLGNTVAAARLKYLRQVSRTVKLLSYRNSNNELLLELYQHLCRYFDVYEEVLMFVNSSYNITIPLNEAADLQRSIFTDEIRDLQNKNNYTGNSYRTDYDDSRNQRINTEMNYNPVQYNTGRMPVVRNRDVYPEAEALEREFEYKNNQRSFTRNEVRETGKRIRKNNSKSGTYSLLIVILIAVLGIGGYFYGWPEYQYYIAGKQLEVSNYDRAADIMESLGDYKDSREQYLIIKTKQADSLVEAYRYDPAIDIYDSLIEEGLDEIREKKNDALLKKWQYYFNLGDYETAYCSALDLKGITDLGENYDLTVSNYIKMLLEQGEVDKALPIFEEMNPESAVYKDTASLMDESLLKKAQTAAENKNYSSAVLYLNAMTIKPDDMSRFYESCYQVGTTALDAGRAEEAIICLENCVDYSDSNEKLNEAKYLFIVENKNSEDEKIKEYLTELAAEEYRDSGEIYKELYGSEVSVSD